VKGPAALKGLLPAWRAHELACVNGMSPALVAALRGQADFNGDGVVELGELRRYVVTHTHRNKPWQHPLVGGNPAAERARLIAVERRGRKIEPGRVLRPAPNAMRRSGRDNPNRTENRPLLGALEEH
jgi:hypothetical protein